jgi:hypothetical protein
VIWVKQLEAEQCKDSLGTERTTINKIAVEKLKRMIGNK